MELATYVGFVNELQKMKTAGLAEHALEVGGLGLLAAPTAYRAITGKKAGERKSRAAELGGLGVLAAHPAYEMGKHLLKRGSADLSLVNAALSLFTKKAESDLWEPATGRVIGGAMGSRAANRGIAGAASAAKPHFTLEHLRSAYAKSGLKPALTSVLKKASVSKEAMGVRPGLGTLGAGILNAGAKAAKGVAKPLGKMVASPQRTSMLQHFTPPSSVNMSRAISL